MIPSPESAWLLWSEVSWTLDSMCGTLDTLSPTLGGDWIMRMLYLWIDRLIGYQR